MQPPSQRQLLMLKKLGLIGCGHIARFHARNLRDALARGSFDIEYHGVCDRIVGRAEQFAEIAGCPLVTADAAELIEACDIVYVCTETAEHPALVSAAAAAGRHLFCEKPLACSLPEAEAMAADVAAAGIINQVGLVLNYSPVYRVLEALMAEEDAGTLLAVHLRDDQCLPVGDHYGSNWRVDVERAGAGTLLEHSIHDVDLLERLFGPIDQVQCRTREISGHPGIEDIAQATLSHAGGHSSTLASVWHAMPRRQSSRSLEVFFERARFTTEHDYFGSIVIERPEGEPVIVSSDEVLARFMELEQLTPVDEDLRSLAGLSDRRFLQAVSGEENAAPTFADAVRGHELVAGCYESARRQGAPINTA